MYFDLIATLLGGVAALGAQFLFDPGPSVPDDSTLEASFHQGSPEATDETRD